VPRANPATTPPAAAPAQHDRLRVALAAALEDETDPDVRAWVESLLAGDGTDHTQE
jgi:hypothetical protein